VNHTCLPKEVHLPDSARRYKQGKKGDCVERGTLNKSATNAVSLLVISQ